MDSNQRDLLIRIDSSLHKLTKKESIENAIIDYDNNNYECDGFLNMVKFVLLKGSNKALNLIVKSATFDPNLRGRLPIRESFLTEITFYEKIHTVHNKIQNVMPAIGIPKCYHTSKKELKEVIVLENLKMVGYDSWDGLRPVDPLHVELVLKELAKLHALSLARKYQEPEGYTQLAESMGDALKKWAIKGELISVCQKLCTNFEAGIKDEVQLERYNKLCDSISSILLNYDYKKDHFAAISHVCCWSDHMMFKYQVNGTTKEPLDVKLMDFQLSRCQSIIYDISVFLCSCTDKQVWERLDYFIWIYHDTLCCFMKEMGTDGYKIMPYTLLKEEFNKKCKFGLIMSSLFMKLKYMDITENLNILEINDPFFADEFLKNISNQTLYEERFQYLIDYFYEHEFY